MRWEFKPFHEMKLEPEVLAALEKMGREVPKPVPNLDNSGNAFVYDVDADGETNGVVCAVRPVAEFKRGKGHESVDPARDVRARLIAAAPDMFAALKVALRAPGIHTTDQETGETFSSVIEAAIAKAEGRA